jgi:hypothetical protein
MPAIYCIHCLSCAAETKYVDVTSVAILVDGSEHPLPHPGEARAAQALGTSLQALRRSYPYLCTSCGAVSYFHAEQPSPCVKCGQPCVRIGWSPKVDGCAVVLVVASIAAYFRSWTLVVVGLSLALILIASYVISTRRYQQRIATLRCRSCGSAQLREKFWGIS